MSEHTVPAFTEANRRRVDPNACACRVDDGEIIYCALHAAAPKLLVALNAMLRAHPLSGTRCACPAHKLAREAIKEVA
jgi:hypothetical protein